MKDADSSRMNHSSRKRSTKAMCNRSATFPPWMSPTIKKLTTIDSHLSTIRSLCLFNTASTPPSRKRPNYSLSLLVILQEKVPCIPSCILMVVCTLLVLPHIPKITPTATAAPSDIGLSILVLSCSTASTTRSFASSVRSLSPRSL